MIYLGLGSNIEDRKKYLESAIQLLENQNVKIVKKSTIIETKAWGIEDQSDFLNQVISVEFTESAYDLLDICLEIEMELGRKREIKWGPRTIDIDILSFHNQIITSKNLQIPHKMMSQRLFVLEPLQEISPKWVHPINNKSIQELINEIKK